MIASYKATDSWGSSGRRVLRSVLLVVCSLLLAEVTSRGLFSVGHLFWRAKGMDDSSQRIVWLKRHSRGQRFVYAFDIYHPTRGWAVTPGLHDLPVFENKILNSNSRGVRGKAEYDYARQPKRNRIVTLGDSFTFGDEVSDDETYSSNLARLLPNTEVLNLGVHSYGHDQMLLYLKEEGIRYHPDLVVLGYVWFDTTRNLLSFNDFAKPKFELTRDGLQLTHVPVPTPASVLAWEPFRLKILDLAVMAQERVRWVSGRNQRRAEEVTAAIFDELIKTTREGGAVPVFVYLPVLQEIADPEEGLTQNEDFLARYCRDRAAVCLFLRPRFREQISKGATFNTRSHWLAPEHLLAAQAMRDLIYERRLLGADSTGQPR